MRTVRRRRKKHKTDYGKRLNLLKGGKPRISFRKTNRYLITQYIKSKEAQDRVDIGFDSKKLLGYGWPKELKNSLNTVPASYLTGFLMGNKIKKENLETPVVDFGMLGTIHKSKVFAFLKGLKDAGLNIKTQEKTFSEEDRIGGKHMKKNFSDNFEKIKSNISKEPFKKVPKPKRNK